MIPAPRWLRSGKVPEGTKLSQAERTLLRCFCDEADTTGWINRSAQWLADEIGICRQWFYKLIARLKDKCLVASEARKIYGRRVAGWRLTLDGVRITPREDRADWSEVVDLRRQVEDLNKRLEQTRTELERALGSGGLQLVRGAADTPPAAPREAAEAVVRGLASRVVTFVVVGGHRVYGEPQKLAELRHAGHDVQIEQVPLWPREKPLNRQKAVVVLAEAGWMSHRSVEEVMHVLWWYRVHLADDPTQLRWWNSHLFGGPFETAIELAMQAEARHTARLDALCGRPIDLQHRSSVAGSSKNLSIGTVLPMAVSAASRGPPTEQSVSDDEQREALRMLEASGLAQRPVQSDSAVVAHHDTVQSDRPVASDLSNRTVPSDRRDSEIDPTTDASGTLA